MNSAAKIASAEKLRGAINGRGTPTGTRKRRTIFWSTATTVTFLLAFGLAVSAEHTRRWRQSSYDEFIKGTPHGVAVRSDGRLELAPKFTLLADADASYLWSLQVAPSGS